METQLPFPKGTEPPIFGHVYCGQMVAHLSYCWVLSTCYCSVDNIFLYFYTGSNFSFFSIHIIAIFIQLWVFQIKFYYIASGSTRLSISNASQNSSFVQLTVTVESHILYNGPPLLSSILPLCSGSGSPSNTWFLWPPESTPKWHHIRLSRLCRAHRHDQQTDKQTNRQADTLSAA